jgi:uncharacterized protein YukE
LELIAVKADSLEKQCSELKVKCELIEETSRENERLKISANTMTRDAAESNRLIENYKDEIKKYIDEINRQKISISELKSSCEGTKNVVFDRENEIVSLKLKISQLEETVSSLKSSLKSAESAVAEQRMMYSSLSQQNSNLLQQVHNFEIRSNNQNAIMDGVVSTSCIAYEYLSQLAGTVVSILDGTTETDDNFDSILMTIYHSIKYDPDCTFCVVNISYSKIATISLLPIHIFVMNHFYFNLNLIK